MSRVGNSPIPLPTGVKATVQGGVFVAEGPKGRVRQRLPAEVDVTIAPGQVEVRRTGESRDHRARHGMMRALLANAVRGVTEGFRKDLDVHGVGYRAEIKGRAVHFALGYSHPIVFPMPDGIEILVDDKAGRITVLGADRQQVGQVAAELRGLRPPEPYKGKGIRYVDEVIRRKVGKAGAA
jgi:large subunit ribosomal protein L6